MRFIFLTLLALLVLAILWLIAARPVSLLVDRFYTVSVETLALDHFRYDNGVIEVGRVRLYLMTPEVKLSTVAAKLSGNGRASLVDSGRSFPLGPAHSLPSASGLPDFEFKPDAGDTVHFTLDRSLLSWPTPFAMNFMTGATTSWRRHLYCRLTWTKRSHANLVMLWRVEQGYFTGSAWRPDKIDAITSGLVGTTITQASHLEAAANEYLQRTQHWKASEYHLEANGPTPDGREEIFLALHRDDEQSPHPGAGRSLQLHINYDSRQVTREIADQ